MDTKKEGTLPAGNQGRQGETRNRFREEILRVLGSLGTGRISRERLTAAAGDLTRWRESRGISGLWESPPLMVTATLDDAWGHGLDLIHPCGEAAGLSLHPLGLLQPPRSIVVACRELSPDLLGLTVLQFDTEADLLFISGEISPVTRIIAGGPVFGADPDLAVRAGIHRVMRDARDFLRFLLTLPDRSP